MEIIAKTLTGRTVQLDAVELSQTVADIKRQIEAKEGTPADRQRLVFRGHTLEDERTLSHYELEADEPLVLVRRVVDLAGAPPTDDTEEHRKKLLRAAVLGHDDEVLRLLGRGVDVDSRDKWCADVAQRAAAEVNGTPLCNAASRGHAGTVSILLDDRRPKPFHSPPSRVEPRTRRPHPQPCSLEFHPLLPIRSRRPGNHQVHCARQG